VLRRESVLTRIAVTGKRFVALADEKLTAVVELQSEGERQMRGQPASERCESGRLRTILPNYRARRPPNFSRKGVVLNGNAFGWFARHVARCRCGYACWFCRTTDQSYECDNQQTRSSVHVPPPCRFGVYIPSPRASRDGDRVAACQRNPCSQVQPHDRNEGRSAKRVLLHQLPSLTIAHQPS
jgi:hypothetical protein